MDEQGRLTDNKATLKQKQEELSNLNKLNESLIDKLGDFAKKSMTTKEGNFNYHSKRERETKKGNKRNAIKSICMTSLLR
jgi:hypothetical protein